MANQRELQAAETKKKILVQGFELFSTMDYRKIRMVDIAGKAGVSVGTLYLYFSSKSDIVCSYMRERNAILSGMLEENTGEGVEEQYNRYIDGYLNMILTDGYEFSRAVMLVMIEKNIGRNATDIGHQNASLVRMLENGFSTGELNADKGITAAQFFDIFIASVNGTLVEWLVTKDENVLRQGLENTRLLLRLLK